MSDPNEFLDGMDQEFLEGNVDYALTLEWKPTEGASIDDHTHCIICMRPLKQGDGIGKFEAEGEHVDEYCYRRFLAGRSGRASGE